MIFWRKKKADVDEQAIDALLRRVGKLERADADSLLANDGAEWQRSALRAARAIAMDADNRRKAFGRATLWWGGAVCAALLVIIVATGVDQQRHIPLSPTAGRESPADAPTEVYAALRPEFAEAFQRAALAETAGDSAGALFDVEYAPMYFGYDDVETMEDSDAATTANSDTDDVWL
ncbi:MAG: hypothetical protein KDD44_05585 [Bdellovibrionales bacterium]|nr:hypothetical protein [Bdellovibrionales bacterium]